MYTHCNRKHALFRGGDTRFRPVLPFSAAALVAVGLLSARAAFSQPVQPNFDQARLFSTQDDHPGTDPFGLALADIDLDGDLDLAVSFVLENHIRVWRNNGNWATGTGFDLPPDRYHAGPVGEEHLAKLAFGRMSPDANPPDSYPDLVVVAQYSGVQILSNYCKYEEGGGPCEWGHFRVDEFWVLGVSLVDPVGLVVADFDGNSRNDIAVTGFQWDGLIRRPALAVLWGEGDGSFTEAAFVLGTETGQGYDLVGWYDYTLGGASPLAPGPPPAPNVLAMTNTDSDRLHIFKYAGNRQFTPVSHAGIASQGITAARLNGGPVTDLASPWAAPNDRVRWYEGLGNGNFELKAPWYPVGPNPLDIDSGLLNRGDTWWDLVTANADAGTVTVLVNDGTATFYPHHFPVMSAGEPYPHQVAVGDLNRDGYRDLVTANRGVEGVPPPADESESISVLLNIPP